MSYLLLPSELKHYIRGFGTQHTVLRLSDEEIIEQIKDINPSFDYKEWLEDVKIKKKYLTFAKESKYNNFYDIIKRNNILIILSRNDITIGSDILSQKEQDLLINFLKELNIEFSYNRSGDIVIEENVIEIEKKILLIWLYKSSLVKDRNKFIHKFASLKNNLPILSEYINGVIDSINNKLTLSDQLRWEIYKNQEYEYIKNSKLLNFYKKLDKTLEWSIESSILEISIYIEQEKELLEEAKKAGIKEYHFSMMPLAFNLTNTEEKEILRLDFFFYPNNIDFNNFII